MRPTTIIYARHDTLRMLIEENRRFTGTRRSLLARFQAAWLVFTGQADALLWDGKFFFGYVSDETDAK